MSFSDFSWESSVVGDGDSDGPAPPMFPQARQVNRYLRRYAERYIPEEVFRLGCRIVRTERRQTASSSTDATTVDEGDGKWIVEWVEEEGLKHGEAGEM